MRAVDMSGQQLNAGALQDEYSNMSSDGERFHAESFELESGLVLRDTTVVYKTWGTLNAAADNVIIVGHALTGNADAASWWGGLIGPGMPLDTDRFFVFCANILGSPYGTTSPLDLMPAGGAPWAAPREGAKRGEKARYAADFPYVTVRDSVALHKRVLDELGVRAVHAVVGGSLGGMQALEWLIMYPGLVRRGVLIASSAFQSAWQIGISETQRQAIYRDPRWRNGFYALDAPPVDGLAVARQGAMIWYRAHPAYMAKFGRQLQQPKVGDAADTARLSSGGGGEGAPPNYAVEGYLEEQGRKFLRRGFDANCYVALTRQLDSHDVGRARGAQGGDAPVEAVLGGVAQPVAVVGLESDVLYPLEEQRFMAGALPNGHLHVVATMQGHDGFLLEPKQIGAIIRNAVEATAKSRSDSGTAAAAAAPKPAAAPKRGGWAFAI